jgi:PPOX class probable F420-dependent enzyme
MPGILEERELLQLLAAPEIGVLCTVDAKGRPEGSPVWFEASAQGADKIYVHVARDSKKARNVRANPNVSLTVDTRVAPYRGAVLRGTAEVITFDDALHRRVAVRYLGAEGGAAYLAMSAGAEAETVLLQVTVKSRYTWDYAKGF